MRIKAFTALRPPVTLAAKVASVPYDTVDTEEARGLANGNPISLLRISRPEIEFPPSISPYAPEVYRKAAELFERFQKQGTLIREDKPCVYVYRLTMGRHVQHGIVACCHVEDYEQGTIRRHEKTRQDKEDDRTRHVLTLQANTGPVLLAYRDVLDVELITRETVAGRPLFDLEVPGGVRHTIWRVADAEGVVRAFRQVGVCYIADGHHRAAAAARAGRESREGNPRHTGAEEYNWFLAILFPAGQLQVLPYNRCVKDLGGASAGEFLDAVRRVFTVTEPGHPEPAGPRKAGLYCGGRWYGLEWALRGNEDPVAALDVSVLQNRLLDPVLGIKDPRTDRRIDFVGGIRGVGELVRLVDSGKAAAAFSMYPVRVEEVMAVADAGQIMPPKSTWFEPKPRSGLLIHTW